MHASQFLQQPEKHPLGAMIAVPGQERFLKQSVRETLRELVLGSRDAEETVFAGKEAVLSDVLDELSLISMFGDRRLVVVEDADDFITRFRPQLEKYLEKPAKKSVLVLEPKTWNKSTRLAKALTKSGLTLECSELKGRDLHAWIGQLAQQRFGKQITRDASALLEQLIGNNLGLIEQELSKLSSYVGDRERIQPEDVQTLVGGWRVETTWKMVDALRDGKLNVALECLDNLLAAREAPLKLLGGIAFVYRKYAEATEWARQGTALDEALRKAGVFPNAVRPSNIYLRRMGRGNAEKILTRLMRVDGDLKGRSALPARMRMERLLVELSGHLPADGDL